MSDGFNAKQPGSMPLPAGIKRRKKKVGSTIGTPLAPVPMQTSQAALPRPPFEVHWEDAKLQLKVRVQERDTGHVVADVFCTEPNWLNNAWASVALYGAGEGQFIQKSIPLDAAAPGGCRGSWDFGPLANLVQRLGDQLGLIVFLLLR